MMKNNVDVQVENVESQPCQECNAVVGEPCRDYCTARPSTDYWKTVEESASVALGVAWDECHKIYLAMDDEQDARFNESSYVYTRGTGEVLLGLARAWFDQSCDLRFVNSVTTNAEDPNAGYVALIPQGAFNDEDFDDEESE